MYDMDLRDIQERRDMKERLAYQVHQALIDQVVRIGFKDTKDYQGMMELLDSKKTWGYQVQWDLLVGSIGVVGPTGEQGLTGDPGYRGMPGYKGDRGDPGLLVTRTSASPTSTPSTGFDVPEVDVEVGIDVSQKLKFSDILSSTAAQNPYFPNKRSVKEKTSQQMKWNGNWNTIQG